MLLIRSPQPALTHKARRLGWLAVALLLSLLGSGCAALTNPVYDGIPVKKLPSEFFAKPREDTKTIPLTLLGQPQPEAYRLDAEDTLAVFIEGVLPAEKGAVPPVLPPRGENNLPPAVGYPVIIREDGTLTLPYIEPLQVRGLTVGEVRDKIVYAYTVKDKILKAGKEQILVSLMRARTYRVQVMRQDTGSVAVGNGALSATKRGSGVFLDLQAYENDVLNALSRSGGLPGLDAVNEVIIQRNDSRPDANRALPTIVRIPLRMRDGDIVPFQPEDVVLKKGDIVFIEARDTEVYYTGGILQSHQFTLPRDYDLRVTDAITIAGGPLGNGNFTQNQFTSSIVESGLGSPSPSRVTVMRRTKSNGMLLIAVDLNRACRDPRENILIMPGDTIILQETVGEALTRYTTSVLRLTGTIFNVGSHGSITGNGQVP